MSRVIIIRSTKFNGHIQYIFDENGRLVVADFSNAGMTDEQHGQLCKGVPANIDTLKAMTAKSKSIESVIETTKEVTFEEFWDAYSYKIKAKSARAAWDKLGVDEKRLALMAVPKYLAWLKDKSISQAMASSWLNQRRWEDDLKK